MHACGLDYIGHFGCSKGLVLLNPVCLFLFGSSEFRCPLQMQFIKVSDVFCLLPEASVQVLKYMRMMLLLVQVCGPTNQDKHSLLTEAHRTTRAQ